MLGNSEICSDKKYEPQGVWNFEFRFPEPFGFVVLRHDNAHDGQRLLQRGDLFTQPLHFAL